MSVHSPKDSYLCRQRTATSLLTVTFSLGLLATIENATARIVPVCDRTPEVRDEIVKLVPEVDDCGAVTAVHLAAIRGAFFHSGYDSMSDGSPPNRSRRPPPAVKALRAGDFSGLSSVTTLYLDRTPLTTLPAGVFAGLTSLGFLDVTESKLASLPAGVFSGLTSLEFLLLADNRMTSLPAGTFSDLPSLTSLNLTENKLASLPVGVFSNLPSLQILDLSHNKLTTLPVGIFSSLSSLEVLFLHSNDIISLPPGVFAGLTSLELLLLADNRMISLPAGFFSELHAVDNLLLGGSFAGPLPVNVTLDWVDPGRFQARVPTGAPFEMRIPITVTNGMFDGDSSHLTIPAGRGASDVFSVSRRPGTTSPVTVEIEQFPEIPRGHGGYELVKAALPLIVLGGLSLDFPHFANGATITSDLVLVNVAALPIWPTLYFFDKQGNPIVPSSVVDLGPDWWIRADGSLTTRRAIPPLGELTVSSHGRGSLVTGSVRIVANGPIGGVLRFDSPDIGVAGVGSGSPSQDAIFPVRRQEFGINTGVAIRNMGSSPLTVNCQLMRLGRVLEETEISLSGSGQTARFIDELFAATDTSDFMGSVRCTESGGGLFTGVALEMNFQNQIFTTLPMVSVPQMGKRDFTQLHFPHFANGAAITSDLVLVNVTDQAIGLAIHFYDGDGHLIPPERVLDLAIGFRIRRDGALEGSIHKLGELTISTHGRRDLVTGSVKIIANGPVGGFLRFDNSEIGVAGVGASEAVQDAIFPARHQVRGIRTGMAIRNLKKDAIDITCQLMRAGKVLKGKEIPLAGHGQTAQFIHELFPQTVTSDFVGSVRCTTSKNGRFTGLALEMDATNGIFTTLPVVPVLR